VKNAKLEFRGLWVRVPRGPQRPGQPSSPAFDRADFLACCHGAVTGSISGGHQTTGRERGRRLIIRPFRWCRQPPPTRRRPPGRPPTGPDTHPGSWRSELAPAGQRWCGPDPCWSRPVASVLRYVYGTTHSKPVPARIRPVITLDVVRIPMTTRTSAASMLTRCRSRSTFGQVRASASPNRAITEQEPDQIRQIDRPGELTSVQDRQPGPTFAVAQCSSLPSRRTSRAFNVAHWLNRSSSRRTAKPHTPDATDRDSSASE